MIGTAKTLNYQDFRNRLYAGLKRISHKSSRLLAVRNLADTACRRHRCYGHYYHLPHQETQA